MAARRETGRTAPGWVLVGDAGYNRDFVTAQGILDAFRDAELCATAIDQSLSGARPFEEAMSEYQRTRDAQARAMYDFTCELATLEPPPPELQRILEAVHGNQAAMDGFARLNAGTISPEDFLRLRMSKRSLLPQPRDAKDERIVKAAVASEWWVALR